MFQNLGLFYLYFLNINQILKKDFIFNLVFLNLNQPIFDVFRLIHFLFIIQPLLILYFINPIFVINSFIIDL